jgi:hypothetical protein
VFDDIALYDYMKAGGSVKSYVADLDDEAFGVGLGVSVVLVMILSN